MIQPTNETLYLPSLPPSFHAKFMNESNNTTDDTVYFTLPTQPLYPDQGYAFSRSEMNADFQLPKEASETASAIEFRIIINQDLEWTLVDESITGITVNGVRLHSAENQRLLAGAGCHLTSPKSGATLLAEEPNVVQVGWGGLQFSLYILGKAADYCYPTFAQQSRSIPYSPNLALLSPDINGTHMLKTTDDVDAELQRQTGGDLTKGFYIDPARFTRVANPCQSSAAGFAGGEAETGIDDHDWAVLAGVGQLNLQGEDVGLEVMES